MKCRELQITRIGNSRGIRIPADLLKKYKIRDTVVIEERAGELALRSKNDRKLSWQETFAEMAGAEEDWSDFEETTGDGLHED